VRPLALCLTLALTALAAPARAGRPEALVLLAEGDALAAAGDRDGALGRYRVAIGEDPDLLTIYDHAVPLWIEAQRWDEATRYLERATVRHPDWAHGWYTLGFLYRKTSKPMAAALAYQECAALRPGDASPWYGLAVAHEMLGDGPSAVRAWRRYRKLERDPERASYRAEASRAIDRLLGPPATAAAAARRALVDGGAAAWLRVGTVVASR
jgi:tetratricopeptide (TPR) repeat protein